jgi:prepilin-type N-terminal cleavage/methylation domain-containing protein
MKKAFTLVELLIVVLVLVILMSVAFRLSSIGDSSESRQRTIVIMQKIENCLSGYYAAFGSYPPVKLHGSRNYRLRVNKYGIQ